MNTVAAIVLASLFLVVYVFLFIFVMIYFFYPYNKNNIPVHNKILTYNEYIKNTNYNKKIPIFRTGSQTIKNLHEDIKELYYQILDENPDYVIVYFTADDRKDFINKYYNKYLDTYNKLVPGAYQADLFRVLVVHKHGGVYSDFSMKYLEPLNNLVDLSTYKLVVAIEPYYWGLFNGFFAARAGLDYLLKIADHIKNNVDNEYYGESELDPTGPMTWGRVMNTYLGRYEKSSFYDTQIDGVKFYKLSIYYPQANAFIHDLSSEKFLIQHKLSCFKNYGLYSSKTYNYKQLWMMRKIYKI